MRWHQASASFLRSPVFFHGCPAGFVVAGLAWFSAAVAFVPACDIDAGAGVVLLFATFRIGEAWCVGFDCIFDVKDGEDSCLDLSRSLRLEKAAMRASAALFIGTLVAGGVAACLGVARVGRTVVADSRPRPVAASAVGVDGFSTTDAALPVFLSLNDANAGAASVDADDAAGRGRGAVLFSTTEAAAGGSATAPGPFAASAVVFALAAAVFFSLNDANAGAASADADDAAGRGRGAVFFSTTEAAAGGSATAPGPCAVSGVVLGFAAVPSHARTGSFLVSVCLIDLGGVDFRDLRRATGGTVVADSRPQPVAASAVGVDGFSTTDAALPVFLSLNDANAGAASVDADDAAGRGRGAVLFSTTEAAAGGSATAPGPFAASAVVFALAAAVFFSLNDANAGAASADADDAAGRGRGAVFFSTTEAAAGGSATAPGPCAVSGVVLGFAAVPSHARTGSFLVSVCLIDLGGVDFRDLRRAAAGSLTGTVGWVAVLDEVFCSESCSNEATRRGVRGVGR